MDQRLPGHDRLHVGRKLLALGALLCRDLLVVSVGEAFREEVAKRLAAREPSAYLQSEGHPPVNGADYSESP